MANASDIARQLMTDLKRDFALSEAQAAGVVGNLLHESANFGSLQEISPKSGQGGFGYAQWTGSRRDAFEAYVNRNDLDPASYEANYGFLRHEITSDPYERRQFMKVKQAETAADAARIVSKEYLRPGVPHNDRRVRLAEQAAGLELAPTPATMPAALRSRIPATALAAIEAASGTTKAAAPELAYAGMPAALSTAVQRVQETSVPPALPRARPETPAPDMISTSMAAANAARPVVVKPTQTRAADLAALTAKPTAFLKTDGSGVTDTADIALFGKAPAYRDIGSLPQQAQPTAKAASKMPARLAQSYAAQEANKPAPKPSSKAPAPAQQSSQLIGARTAASVPDAQNAATRAAATKAATLTGKSSGAAKAATDLRTLREANQTAADSARTATVVASYPTTSTAPAQLPQISQTAIGMAPTDRAVQSVRVVPRNTNIADARSEQAEQRKGAPKVPAKLASTHSAFGAFPEGGMAPNRTSGNPANVAGYPVIPDRLPAVAGIDVDPIQKNAALTSKPRIAAVPAAVTSVAKAQAKPSVPRARVAPIPNARPMAVGSALAVTPPMSRVPLVAPVPAMPFAPMNNLTRHPALNLLAAMVGRSDSPLGVLLGNDGIRAPVGAALGTAANGGQMIQGHNGVKNTITQASDAWRVATGQQSRGSGQSNDTRYESYF